MSQIGAIVPIERDAQGRVVMLDQTRLPAEEIYHAYERAEQVADAARLKSKLSGSPTQQLGIAKLLRELVCTLDQGGGFGPPSQVVQRL